MGVYWSKARKRWVAKAKQDKKLVFHHNFPTQELAQAAYDRFIAGEKFEPLQTRFGAKKSKHLIPSENLLEELDHLYDDDVVLEEEEA